MKAQFPNSLRVRFLSRREPPRTRVTQFPTFKTDLSEGTVLLDEQHFKIEVLGGDELEDVLLGVNWLQIKRLVADFPAGVLTLG